jgi:CheY-like chemotaxis protein
VTGVANAARGKRFYQPADPATLPFRYECHVAVNGRKPWWRFVLPWSASKHDLICMDIMMPEMDGHEAVRKMRAIEEANGLLPTFRRRSS